MKVKKVKEIFVTTGIILFFVASLVYMFVKGPPSPIQPADATEVEARIAPLPARASKALTTINRFLPEKKLKLKSLEFSSVRYRNFVPRRAVNASLLIKEIFPEEDMELFPNTEFTFCYKLQPPYPDKEEPRVLEIKGIALIFHAEPEFAFVLHKVDIYYTPLNHAKWRGRLGYYDHFENTDTTDNSDLAQAACCLFKQALEEGKIDLYRSGETYAEFRR